MLKKNNRLKKRKEFNYIYKKGEVVHSADFSIHFVRAFKPYAQIGISVGKQVGNSVVRSRVKRIISEACRLNIEKFAIKNYVITAKPPIANKKSTEVESELLAVLKKKNLLRAENAQTKLAKKAKTAVESDKKTEQAKISAKKPKSAQTKGKQNV